MLGGAMSNQEEDEVMMSLEEFNDLLMMVIHIDHEIEGMRKHIEYLIRWRSNVTKRKLKWSQLVKMSKISKLSKLRG